MVDRKSSRTASKKEKLGEPQLQAVASLFAVLSEPTRLRILQMLQDGPASVTEIINALGVKQANASKQLGILHQAGLLSREKDGNTVRYAIRMPLVFDLCDLVCNSLRADAEEKLKLLA
jgi:DNA-binding transcriptional ArsR family regulator